MKEVEITQTVPTLSGWKPCHIFMMKRLL